MSKSSVRVRAIAKKELVEFVRDWRTILAILIIPLLMFPLLFILFPLLLASEAAELDALVVDVVVQGDDIPADMGLLLNNSTLNITYEPLPALEVLSTPQGDEGAIERWKRGCDSPTPNEREYPGIRRSVSVNIRTKFGGEKSYF